jgi:Escherichia/Staphylococcus phage prohead protease
MSEKIWSAPLGRFVLMYGPDWAAHLAAMRAIMDPAMAPDSPLRRYLDLQAEAEKKYLSVAEYGERMHDQAGREAAAREWYEKAYAEVASAGAAHTWPAPLPAGGLEVKMRRTDPRTAIITGYLSTFGNSDHMRDVVVKGAFDATLKKRRGKSILMPVLWCHNAEIPIGGVTAARSDSHGLYIEALLDLETRAGKEAYSAIAKRYSASLSMGYRTVRDSYDGKGNRLLHEVELMEASVVPLPANEAATILSARVVTEGE